MTTTQKSKPAAPVEIHPPGNLLDVLRTLFRWKKEILGICLLTGVGAAVIVMLLPVYYTASTTFLATSPDQATPELLFGEGGIAPELYGNENDIDRLLTIASSNELVDYLVDSFDLYEHYDVDKESPRGRHYVRKSFRGMYEVTKTKRDAIQISMEDQDPELAAQMARVARQRINHLAQGLIKSTQERSINAFEGDIRAKEVQLQTLSDTLKALRETYGIYNTEAQSESITTLASTTESNLTSAQAKLEAFRERSGRFRDSVAVYEVKVAGLEVEMTKLQEKLGQFNKGFSRVQSFARQYLEANISLSEDKEKLKQYQAIYNSDIPAVILVEEASVPLIKSRPFRTLVVLASVAVAFFFSVIGVLLFETYRDIDWRAILNG